jgi:hypothetical protein
MQETEGKKPKTVKNYADAIDQISQHYSSETGNNIDLYQIIDISLLRKISTEYKKKVDLKILAICILDCIEQLYLRMFVFLRTLDTTIKVTLMKK